MKILKEHPKGILLCLFELIVGILLLVDPEVFTAAIITVTGIALMIMGVVSGVKYFRKSAAEAAYGQELAKGILFLLCGAFCALRTDWFLVTFPVLTILYGIEILLNGVSKIQLTVDMLRLKSKKWFFPAIGAVIAILCAVLILSNPFGTVNALWIFTGVSLIVEGVMDIISVMLDKKNKKENAA